MDYTCKNCGNTYADELGVCPSCGTPVESKATDAQQPNFQQQGYQNAYNPNGYQAGAPVYNQNMVMQPRSRIAAGLLGVFLGAWGVHNFYLGFTSKAVTQILVTVVTCGIGGLWGFIEGIMILAGSINTDADGNPLQD